jgi:hypothetical protein
VDLELDRAVVGPAPQVEVAVMAAKPLGQRPDGGR